MADDIYRAKVLRCFDLLTTSLESLEQMTKLPKIEPNEYYRIRNQVREAKAALDEVMKETHRLFGPAPAYASADFEALRRQSLEKAQLLLRAETKEEIISELWQDELVKRFFSLEEVKPFVEAQFESQRKGKRRLFNLKARLLIEKMKQQLEKATGLLKDIKGKVGLP